MPTASAALFDSVDVALSPAEWLGTAGADPGGAPGGYVELRPDARVPAEARVPAAAASALRP
jgi:hypothetical protein